MSNVPRIDRGAGRQHELLSEEKVAELISHHERPRNRLIVAMLYSLGLRPKELARLRVSDVLDASALPHQRLRVRAERTKTSRERHTTVPPPLAELILEYAAAMSPEQLSPEAWLFPGSDPRWPIVVRTVERIHESAAEAAGTPTAPYTARHDCATRRVLEGIAGKGVGEVLKIISEEMGMSIRVLMKIYVHVAGEQEPAVITAPFTGIFELTSSPPEEMSD